MGGVNPINVYRKNNDDILKGVNSPEQPKIKPKGQFKFKLDIDTHIRNGESGLTGKNTGLRRSVAVGKGNQIWSKNI